MGDLLASSGEDSDDQTSIKINQDYANNYNRFREKEVFQRLKSKYGEEVAEKKLREAESDSDSSTEDESAEELTEQIEKDFFKTLSCLKSKDPRIYDGKTKFFDHLEPSSSKPKEKKDKPMYLRDLERKVMLEKGGKYDDMDEFEQPTVSYQEELDEIKTSLKLKVDSDSEDDTDNGGLLSIKVKSKAEKDKDEEDFKTWLAGQTDHLSDEQSKADLNPLREFWSNEKLDEKEKFLRDYILNQKFRKGNEENEESDSEESIGSDNFSEDEKTLKEQEEFEMKYNFRFEEPDQDFIKRYPRTIKDSMRTEPSLRKKKRLEVKDRKEREKEKKKEEIKQLKALKRKEIMEKLDKLKKIAGTQDLELNEDDLEEDFDPEKYDRRMKEIFENYDTSLPGKEDLEKPEFSDLESDLEEELEVENWDDWDGEEREKEHIEEEGIEKQEEFSRKKLTTEMVELSRKRKRKSKFAEMIERKKPLFDPNDKTFEEYLNEYYNLEFEDLVGDLPCRFKYRKVEDNDFGLTAHEVLSAPDGELNAWCSLRKTCQFRSDQEEKKEKLVYKSKANNIDLKKKILPSLFSENQVEKLSQEQEKKASRSKKRRKKKLQASANIESQSKGTESLKSVKGKRNLDENYDLPVEKKLKLDADKKRKKKRRKKNLKDTSNVGVDITTTEGFKQLVSPQKSSKKNKSVEKVKKKSRDKVNAEYSMSDERLKAYGLNPRKLKRKLIAKSMTK